MEFLTQRSGPTGSPAVKRFSPRRAGEALTGSWIASRRQTLLFLLIISLGSLAAQTQRPVFKEYDLKAAFLFNLAQFVEWPPEAFPAAETPFVIGVLGPDPFGKALEEVVRNEVVGDRKLAVQRYGRVEEISLCHILFISPSEVGRLDAILSSLKGRKILTVGDTEGFAQRGGIVRFVTEQNKIRLRINNNAAKAAGLTISSKLLRAADRVGSGGSK